MARARRVTTCLSFPGNAEEAVESYVALFDDSRVVSVQRAGAGGPLPEGTALFVQFELLGTPLAAINGQPDWAFSESASLMVGCVDQAELDRYWDRLVADGGQPLACGWIRDRFGLSWQIVPDRLSELMARGDDAANARLLEALWGMVKLDVAALEAAHAGD